MIPLKRMWQRAIQDKWNLRNSTVRLKSQNFQLWQKMFQMKLGKPMGIWTSWYMRMGKMQRSCFPAVQKSLQLCFPQKNQRKWLLVRNTKNSKLMEFKVRSVCQKQSMRNMDMSEPLESRIMMLLFLKLPFRSMKMVLLQCLLNWRKCQNSREIIQKRQGRKGQRKRNLQRKKRHRRNRSR